MNHSTLDNSVTLFARMSDKDQKMINGRRKSELDIVPEMLETCLNGTYHL